MPTYHVSRSLFRVLVPMIRRDAPGQAGTNRKRVLDACETTMARLEGEPDLADPTRFLFGQVRTCFSIGQQAHVRHVIALHVELAREAIALQAPEHRPCSAFTRQGTPCQREARPESRFCPSHKHLDLISELKKV
jgi:hypothetical protein